MTQVPERVLSWLYSVLHEYRDPKRTYSDIVLALSTTSTLSPRTEVYTYQNGSHALLVIISGTIPVDFRGTIYRFPVKIWIPQSYPQEPPMAYVVPAKEIIVRPGQHVGADGRVYHPYLRDWGQMWNRASIAEFLGILQQVFAKEPPVINKGQQQHYQRPIGHAPQPPTAGGTPQIPPKERIGGSSRQELPNSGAPPRPPKPQDESSNAFPPRSSSRDASRDGPPPPPLPPEVRANNISVPHQQHLASHASFTIPSNPRIPSLQQAYANGTASGLPSRSQPEGQPSQQRSGFDRSPVSPISPMNGHDGLAEQGSSIRAPAVPQQQLMPPNDTRGGPPPRYQQAYVQQPPPQQRAFAAQQHQTFTMQTVPPKQPLPDLLSDPFDVVLPGRNSSTFQAAPPIPPNPEKEHLLEALTSTLVPQAQQKVQQNLSFLAPLQAQHSALQAAHARLQADLHTLQRLDAALTSNEAILRRSIADCDATIAAAREKPPPPVDEVLIAPTMVANQLWTLCAEEAAVREAMYVLQKAVDGGRVGGPEFVKQMRNLGRERFLKMVLARKCARGLGLELPGAAGGGIVGGVR